MRLILLVLLSIPFLSNADDGWYEDGQLISDGIYMNIHGRTLLINISILNFG